MAGVSRGQCHHKQLQPRGQDGQGQGLLMNAAAGRAHAVTCVCNLELSGSSGIKEGSEIRIHF